MRISHLAVVCSAIAFSSASGSAAFSQEGAKRPPFPPDYKTQLAFNLVLQYVIDSDGRPEISDIHTSAGPFGSSASLCLQYPLHKKFGPLSSDGKRHIVIYGEGRTFEKRDTMDSCVGRMKPFVELEQAARLVKTCGSRGEQRCTVGHQKGRSVFITLPSHMLSSKAD